MNREKTTWRELITEEMEQPEMAGETVIACTLPHGITDFSDAEFDRKFYCGYGMPEGSPFTVWTQNWVLFPTCYDGAESVGRVRRHPSIEPTCHIGGW